MCKLSKWNNFHQYLPNLKPVAVGPYCSCIVIYIRCTIAYNLRIICICLPNSVSWDGQYLDWIFWSLYIYSNVPACILCHQKAPPTCWTPHPLDPSLSLQKKKTLLFTSAYCRLQWYQACELKAHIVYSTQLQSETLKLYVVIVRILAVYYNLCDVKRM